MTNFVPTFHGHRGFKAVGIRRWHDFATASHTIPTQWVEFNGLGLPNQTEARETFGITCQADMTTRRMEYMTAYEVEDFQGFAEELGRIVVPAGHYAVFTIDTVAEIQPLWAHLFSTWLPTSGYKVAETPNFERYDERFDTAKRGPLEVWLPLER